MTFMAWPEIEGFHNIRKYIRVDPTEWWKTRELLSGTSTVTYRAKVKLHGTNAAIQLHEKGEIICQSRESIITPEKDNAGFARWAMTNKEKWNRTIDNAYVNGLGGWIIYGEWCGPGIQKGVAISEIPKKVFAVFAARPLDGSDRLIIEPEDLSFLVKGVADVYVLPWHTHQLRHGSDTHVYTKVDVDWKQTDEELTATVAPINDWVLAIEANDPWVEQTFGVKGTGEGLVFYPYSEPHLGYEHFNNLCFKAKGEKHKNIATAKPVQVSAEAAASIGAFVDMVLTPARLEQGTTKVSADGALTYDMKNTGKFVTWVSADVEKETQDELAASGLTWKEVQKPISDKARAWYLAKAKGG
jgi:hypothetical protein